MSEPTILPQIPTGAPAAKPLRANAPRYIDISPPPSTEEPQDTNTETMECSTIFIPLPLPTPSTSTPPTLPPHTPAPNLDLTTYARTQHQLVLSLTTRLFSSLSSNPFTTEEELDLPQAPDYLSHHVFSDAYTWAMWEREAARDFNGVKAYLDAHPVKKEELRQITGEARRYWEANGEEYERWFPLVEDGAESGGSQSASSVGSGQEGVLGDPAIVSVKVMRSGEAEQRAGGLGDCHFEYSAAAQHQHTPMFVYPSGAHG